MFSNTNLYKNIKLLIFIILYNTIKAWIFVVLYIFYLIKYILNIVLWHIINFYIKTTKQNILIGLTIFIYIIYLLLLFQLIRIKFLQTNLMINLYIIVYIINIKSRNIMRYYVNFSLILKLLKIIILLTILFNYLHYSKIHFSFQISLI